MIFLQKRRKKPVWTCGQTYELGKVSCDVFFLKILPNTRYSLLASAEIEIKYDEALIIKLQHESI